MTRQEARFKERWAYILAGAQDTIYALKPPGWDYASTKAYHEAFDTIKAAQWKAVLAKADI